MKTLGCLLLCVLGSVAQVRGQASAEVVGPTEKVPRDSFKSWSLFLVCNPSWIQPGSEERIWRLYRQFKSFGRTIGDDNLAVWFWKSRMELPAS